MLNTALRTISIMGRVWEGQGGGSVWVGGQEKQK